MTHRILTEVYMIMRDSLHFLWAYFRSLAFLLNSLSFFAPQHFGLVLSDNNNEYWC